MIANLVQQEMGKLLQNKAVGQTSPNTDMNFSNFSDFAGSILSHFSNSVLLHKHEVWIVDSGTSIHMCDNLKLFSSYQAVKDSTPVQLLDNSTKLVEYIGTISLNTRMILQDCLYISSFKYNLLSVSKLSQSANLVFNFYHAFYQKLIGWKWVYKVKCKPNGEVEQYNARLVLRGYNQIEDHFESFSHVAKTVTIRTVLALAAVKDWHLHQLDINNAFLHGYLDEDIYMEPPEGYEKVKPGQVCKLKRSLYGIPREDEAHHVRLPFYTKVLQGWIH
ncbi:hypothetical protein LIER_41166 [Lithospermum erythrorhizon]|uniref:Reverse transcriptase Ty1/copia-type domain-containing protein n=1 Tax=Lithospermum erythrorhizon TaxID=34254 RepID=A0AAV3R6J5_LITER